MSPQRGKTREEKEAGCRGLNMTLGLGKNKGEEWACRVLRIIPECEKVLRGQFEASTGSNLLNLLQAPTFLPVCPGS